jgi:5'-nucleotidase
MPYPIEKKLVVAIASSALFDLAESDAVYRKQGRDAYRRHQRRNERKVLRPGVAFPFIKRLLSLRAMNPKDPPVEVVLLSRNDPDTGLRVFNSIEKHRLDISRAAFTSGEQPYLYMASFNACLFLSANDQDVRDAIAHGQPAGLVLPSKFADDPKDRELRIAFDFDGVVGSDEAEKVFRRKGLPGFNRSEKKKAARALAAGPLQRLLAKIAGLQRHEADRHANDQGYKPRVRTAIMTARCAPAHKRVMNTLRRWGITVDEVFFLGGIQKKRVLEIFKPHLFFDDQQGHLTPVARSLPCVHVPFGVVNTSGPRR